ncbi:hypothetical protein [Hydrogenimonas cancrithermarum]|uniref:Class I SAM-dependent methyltransferase n=1 Tax=Hydrogenimonas cancrithermarum TaxID=2993563 RepID=A0ABM8FPQ1_9BACT|nr:hypothetical protein [Hydrogenimonas cancrithermarum]BDY14015.1 hypothetical protein HCR_23280 [Hydrogenimonas cancrithermarum]
MRCYDQTEDVSGLLARLFPAIDPESLPSFDDEDFMTFANSYEAREAYLKRFGYTLVCREFIAELSKELHKRGVRDFVELEAGMGMLSLLLRRSGFEGVGYTLPPEDEKWPIDTANTCYREALTEGCLVHADIRQLTLQHSPGAIVASWIPLGGGSEVAAFFENQWRNDLQTPLFVLIGEDRGGCTTSDDFFDWLEHHFEPDGYNESYVPFQGFRDYCGYFRRRK